MNYLSDTLESRLLAACAATAGATNPCLQAVMDHLAAGGSRVRAGICLDAATRLGLDEADAVLAAAACELLHNASLLQDDLLDRTPLRRGAPSVWVRYGDAVAVCAGDLMLSATYNLLADLSPSAPVAKTLRLLHLRTREVILGQAAESLPQPSPEGTEVSYERLARGKSASLLSLALELPLLLAGHEEALPLANAAASDFAVAYQIADDLEDCAQDAQEGSSNLVLLLVERDHLTVEQASQRAQELAIARLISAKAQAERLPDECAATLLQHVARLRGSLLDSAAAVPAGTGV